MDSVCIFPSIPEHASSDQPRECRLYTSCTALFFWSSREGYPRHRKVPARCLGCGKLSLFFYLYLLLQYKVISYYPPILSIFSHNFVNAIVLFSRADERDFISSACLSFSELTSSYLSNDTHYFAHFLISFRLLEVGIMRVQDRQSQILPCAYRPFIIPLLLTLIIAHKHLFV